METIIYLFNSYISDCNVQSYEKDTNNLNIQAKINNLISDIISINSLYFFDDGTYTNVEEMYSIFLGYGTIEYVSENGLNVLHGITTNSSSFWIAPNTNVTNESDFTLECDWKATNYWNGGRIGFDNHATIGFYMYQSPGALINYKCKQNTYFHIKLEYYNKVLTLYINDSLVGQATNPDYEGRLSFFFGGDRTNFEYYVKNLKITV